jgi:hypothetical protein
MGKSFAPSRHCDPELFCMILGFGVSPALVVMSLASGACPPLGGSGRDVGYLR